MYLALYIMSAAISMRRILYMAVKNLRSWSLFVFTLVEGGSILCVGYAMTCQPAHTLGQRASLAAFWPREATEPVTAPAPYRAHKPSTA